MFWAEGKARKSVKGAGHVCSEGSVVWLCSSADCFYMQQKNVEYESCKIS